MSTEDNRKPDPDRLGAAVRRRRKHLGLTVKQVATAAGISVRSVSSVESGAAGHHLRSATLDGLDRALLWMQGSARRVYEKSGRPQPRRQEPQDEHTDKAVEERVVLRAQLPRPVELALLSHLAARRQDLEAALEAEASTLVELLGPMLAPWNLDGQP